MTRSPRLSPPPEARGLSPEPVTDTEIDALISLAHRVGARNVAIGHGRDGVARADAARFASGWETGGGVVLGRVSWPDEAASWLRQSRRLVDPGPDLWVLGGAAVGLAQMVRRLALSPRGRPAAPWSSAAVPFPRCCGSPGAE